MLPGPDPDLHRIRPDGDQRLDGLARGDVPRDHVDRLLGLDLLDDVEDALRVAVRRVDDEHVGTGVDERGCPLERIRPDTDGRADPEPAAFVLRRERVRLALRDVLDGDQAAEPAGVIDDRQLLDAMLCRGSPAPGRASSPPAR